MAYEIERKYLLRPEVDINEIIRMAVHTFEIGQGYLSADPDVVVRVRRINRKGCITVKTRNRGIRRHEWEYEIPLKDAVSMMELPAVKSISKTRYIVPYKGLNWEVDVFHGRLQGLVMAEVELEHEHQDIEKPFFVGEDVSHDARYFNSNLIDVDFDSLKRTII